MELWGPERPAPARLTENEGCAYLAWHSTHDLLWSSVPLEGYLPALGGKEVNTPPATPAPPHVTLAKVIMAEIATAAQRGDVATAREIVALCGDLGIRIDPRRELDLDV